MKKAFSLLLQVLYLFPSKFVVITPSCSHLFNRTTGIIKVFSSSTIGYQKTRKSSKRGKSFICKLLYLISIGQIVVLFDLLHSVFILQLHMDLLIICSHRKTTIWGRKIDHSARDTKVIEYLFHAFGKMGICRCCCFYLTQRYSEETFIEERTIASAFVMRECLSTGKKHTQQLCFTIKLSKSEGNLKKRLKTAEVLCT